MACFTAWLDFRTPSDVVGRVNPRSIDRGACRRSKSFCNPAGPVWKSTSENTGSSCGWSGDTKCKAHRVLPAVCIWRGTHHCEGNLGRHCEFSRNGILLLALITMLRQLPSQGCKLCCTVCDCIQPIWKRSTTPVTSR